MALRSMSPVAMCGILNSPARRLACVPFPAAGGPKMSRRLDIPRSPCLSLGSHRAPRPAAAADARPLGSGEAFVVPGDEVGLDLLHGVQGHADHDHEAGAAEAEGHAQ